jgi:hypothetical protein
VKVTVAVVAIILLAVASLLGVTYLMYRDAPRTATPGKIDNAAGVTPQYPPVAPAEDGTRSPEATER